MILDNSTFNISTKLTKYGKDYLRNNGTLDIKYFSLSDEGVDYQDLNSSNSLLMYESAEVGINNIGSILIHKEIDHDALNITVKSNEINIINKLEDIDENNSNITIINSNNKPVKLYYNSDKSSDMGTIIEPSGYINYMLKDGLNTILWDNSNNNTLNLYIIDNRTNQGQNIIG